ncbi:MULTISPECIES: class I SAM-dependent methyltransferase [Rhizobium]|uniref:class I SAM-dependent methyltransferase n=1 Tax=Rhizobium TaxID=379 RepID=UPI00103CFEF8|nr:methyltransferase domain-containing protein [Rhizobium leguminosarum]TBZ20995.1 methyltransferase domain-containing protein [Rhizobium leguminosarum bv. viciae]
MKLVITQNMSFQLRGEKVIASGSGARDVVELPIELLSLIAEFSFPRDPDAMALPTGTRQLVDRLSSLGLLQEEPISVHTTTCDPVSEYLSPVANALGSLANEANVALAYGLDDFQRMYSVDIARILQECRASIAHLLEKLRLFNESRARSISRDIRIKPLRINIGSRDTRLDNWINLDLRGADLNWNIARGLPFPDKSVSTIYAAYVLEHLMFPDEVKTFLCDAHRVLSTGGAMRIVVPNLRGYADAYLRGQELGWYEPKSGLREPKQPLAARFLQYAGAGAPPGAFDVAHRFAYDFETLEELLLDAGFARVIQSNYMSSEIDELLVDHASSVASENAQIPGRALFVDALRD